MPVVDFYLDKSTTNVGLSKNGFIKFADVNDGIVENVNWTIVWTCHVQAWRLCRGTCAGVAWCVSSCSDSMYQSELFAYKFSYFKPENQEEWIYIQAAKIVASWQSVLISLNMKWPCDFLFFSHFKVYPTRIERKISPYYSPFPSWDVTVGKTPIVRHFNWYLETSNLSSMRRATSAWARE